MAPCPPARLRQRPGFGQSLNAATRRCFYVPSMRATRRREPRRWRAQFSATAIWQGPMFAAPSRSRTGEATSALRRLHRHVASWPSRKDDRPRAVKNAHPTLFIEHLHERQAQGEPGIVGIHASQHAGVLIGPHVKLIMSLKEALRINGLAAAI